jgi:heme/copper-type cytochrome/quinol oxidase subunit 3
MKHSNPHVQEDKQNLWLLAISPTIWAAHFLLCYITAAIWCAKYAGPNQELGIVRPAIVIYTILAVAGISITGWIGYRKHSYGNATLPHDADSPEDRHRFLGFATLLLSALSLIGTLFAAMVVVFFGRCH